MNNQKMILFKLVDHLKFTISMCEDKNLTEGQKDIFEARKELAESLLELITIEGGTK